MSFYRTLKKALKGVLFLPVAGIGLLLLWFVFTVLNKAYWDAWVTRMCTSTDLVTVFETVDLSDPAYSSLPLGVTGLPIIPFDSARDAGDPFYIRSTSDIDRRFAGLNTGIYETEIVRAADQQVMSVRRWFSRTGGDIIDIGSGGSNYSCSDVGRSQEEQRRLTFVISEE